MKNKVREESRKYKKSIDFVRILKKLEKANLYCDSNLTTN